MTGLPQEFLRVALTGGIATGKTYVLARLAALGVPTIDADVLARKVVQPGSAAWKALGERFGPDILESTGELNRKTLAAIVFRDPAARRDLEAIIHPGVYEKIGQWFAALRAEGDHRFGIADIPLLYETIRAAEFDRVIVTACDPQTQVRRVVARGHATEDEAEQRLAAQQSIAEKVARADFVIWTDRTRAQTDREVEALYHTLATGHEKRPPGNEKQTR